MSSVEMKRTWHQREEGTVSLRRTPTQRRPPHANEDSLERDLELEREMLHEADQFGREGTLMEGGDGESAPPVLPYELLSEDEEILELELELERTRDREEAQANAEPDRFEANRQEALRRQKACRAAARTKAGIARPADIKVPLEGFPEEHILFFSDGSINEGRLPHVGGFGSVTNQHIPGWTLIPGELDIFERRQGWR